MFDSRLAKHMDREAGEYAKRIDWYCQRGQATPQWVEAMKTARLATHDTAGNMHTGRGISSGYAVDAARAAAWNRGPNMMAG